MYEKTYWRTLAQNRGTIPRRIDRSRFWELLEVMYPAQWKHEGEDFECFAVSEPQTGDLHTWCIRVGSENPEYWETIAPIYFTTEDLHKRVLIAIEMERKMV